MCDVGRVVDGDISMCMWIEDIGIWLNNDKKIWWYVDLGGVYNVYNIRILFMDYCGESKYVCNLCWFIKVELCFILDFI